MRQMRGFRGERYLCLAEFAVSVLLQRLQLLVLLFGFIQLVLKVGVFTGALLELKSKTHVF